MRTKFCLAAVLTAATLTTAVAAAQKDFTGNGAPSGWHYNLNIIGVPHYKNPDLNQGSGNVIFVMLGSNDTKANTKIGLLPGEFGVLDKNGTDGTASFSLPAGGYTVWVRPRGKPGGWSKMALCGVVTFTDPTTLLQVTDTLCSLGHVATRETGHGKNSFNNVTPELTTITLDAAIVCAAGPLGGTTIPSGTTLSLFDPCLQSYFWDYDNYGLKLLQVRFYPDA